MSETGNPPTDPASTAAQPVHHRHRRHAKLIAVIAGLLMAAAVVALAFRPKGGSPAALPGVRSVKAITGPLEQTLMLTGQTASRDFVDIKSPIMRGFESGRELILLYLVPSGTRVKKGDKIAAIDGQATQDHVDDIGDTISAAEADIRKRKSEQEIDLENLRQSLVLAKSELDKARLEFAASETRTAIDKELLRLAVEEAEAKYKESLADVQHKEKAHKAEIRILEITRERHVRHRDRHKNDLNKYTFYSPMEDGLAVVQSVWRGGEWATIQQGDQLQPGQLFLKVVNPASMIVLSNANQSESSHLRIGQQARIRLDAFPGLVLPGKVFSIGAIATGGWRTQYYIRNVPVKIAIEGFDSKLIPDLSASVEILLNREENVVQIPLAAVFTENGQTVVYVNKPGQPERRVLEIGISSSTHVAVKSGLSAGEEVLLEAPPKPQADAANPT